MLLLDKHANWQDKWVHGANVQFSKRGQGCRSSTGRHQPHDMDSDAMKTTEILDVEQALMLIEQVLVRGGDNGEHLVASSTARPEDDRSDSQRRLALRKSLLAAASLLTVAHRLMDPPGEMSGRDLVHRSKATIEKLKLAARGAYEAGHLLVGVSVSPRD